MKRTQTILLTLLMVLTFTAVREAEAEWWGQKNKETRKANVQRLDRVPTMGFYRGILSSGSHGGWVLDGTPVGFAPDCKISAGEAEGISLRSGATVILMGQKVGAGILARQVLIQSPDHDFQGMTRKASFVNWSRSDPTVGESGPVEGGSN